MRHIFFVSLIVFFGCNNSPSVNDAETGDQENDFNDSIITDDFDDEVNDDFNDDDTEGEPGLKVNLSAWQRISDGLQFNNYSAQSLLSLNNKFYLISGDQVYSSEDGLNWLTTNNNAPFKSRIWHSALTFKDKMVIIGGGLYTPLGDIWSSEDGVVWNFLTGSAPFGARSSLSAIFFKDKLWVMGGTLSEASCTECNGLEIWSTSDLKNWEKSSKEAPFTYHQIIEHKEQLWLFAMDAETQKNSIWKSDDGTNWENVLEEIPFGYRGGVSFYSWKKKLWIAGGYGSDYEYFSDVWASEDGITWVKTGDFEDMGGRSGSSAITKDEEVFLLSGYKDGLKHINEIISSKDGSNWEMRWGHNALPDRFSHTVNHFKNKFWVIGGRVRYSENGVKLSDIYSSVDGKEWNLVFADAPFGYRVDHATVVFKEKLWVFGGDYHSSGSYAGDVWSSEDGVSWDVVLPLAPFDRSRVQEAFVYDNEIVLVAGKSDGTATSFWYSENGIDWRQGISMPFMGCRNAKIVVHEDDVFMIGGCAEKDIKGNDVYKRMGEDLWLKVKTENIFSPRRGHGVISMGGFIWVIAGSDGDDLNDVWYSKDGKKWYQAKDGVFDPRANFAVSSYDSKIWIFGGFELVKNGYDFGDTWVAEIDSIETIEEIKNEDEKTLDFEDIEWKLAGKMPSKRLNHSFLKTEEGIYIIGGELWEDDSFNKVNSVIFSKDGIAWETLTSDHELMEKTGVAYVYFNNKIWGIGGLSNYTDVFGLRNTNEIIFSDDGKGWHIASENPGFPPRFNHSAVVFNDKIWIAGGFDPDSNGMNDFWSSSDGINWKRETTVSDFRGRGVAGLHVLNDRMYLVGGKRNYWDRGNSEVWSSKDGISWEKESFLGFSQREMFASTTASGALWVFGGKNRQDDLNDLYFSIDGKTWKEAGTKHSIARRSGAVLWGDGNRIWLSGGASRNSSYYRSTYDDVWYADIEIKSN